tara:strand:+ start:842 stop:1783 length:942 start_codon:yes stop_codon:yes gene_type:complete
MNNNITKAGFKSSGKLVRSGSEAFTPYIVNPDGTGTYLTIEDAIDAVVADGANTDSDLPTLILISSDTHQIGSQLTLPPNIRISGPTDTGFGYLQSQRRAAIVEGSFLIDVDADTSDGIYVLSDLKIKTDSATDSCINVSGGNSNPQLYLDGVTLEQNGSGTAATAFSASNTTFAAYYFFECHATASSTNATLYAPNSGQSILVRNSYVRGTTSDAVNAGSGVSLLFSRVNGLVKGGASGAGHEIKYSEVIATTGTGLIQISSTSTTFVTFCYLQHPLGVVEGTAGSPVVVVEGNNCYFDSNTYINAAVSNIG